MPKERQTKRLLLIVEGERREPQLLERELDVFGLADEHEIVPIGTDLHALLDFIDREYGGEYEDIDIVAVVADFLACGVGELPDKSGSLDGDFTDVLLVFDFDPQDNRFDGERLTRLQRTFCDSTDAGQLYVNYPMVESYRDFDDIKELDYLDETVLVDDSFHGASYKSETAQRRNAFLDVTRANQFDFVRNIALQASKAQHLTESGGLNEYVAWSEDPDLAGEVLSVDLDALLACAIADLKLGRLWACCTCLFFVANWPAAVNGVWRKACEAGLGLGPDRS